MNSFRTLVQPTQSNNIQYSGIWYSKIQVSPSRFYLKMLGTDNLYDDTTFCFIGRYQEYLHKKDLPQEVKNPSNKDLLKHHKIKIEDLESKKPGMLGIESGSYKKVIGKRLKKNLKKNSFLKFEYLV